MKKEINLTLSIPKEDIDEYDRLMNVEELDYEKSDIPRYSTVESWSVNAGDGYEIDVKVSSGNDGDPLWCEAVLFLNSYEQACSGPECSLEGEWQLEANGTRFELNVIAS